MTDLTGAITAADEARAWIQRLVRFADEVNAENEANPVPEEMCPPTHVNAVVRLKPLPDGRVSVYEPGVEITPDRLRAFLVEHDEQRERVDKAEAEVAWLQTQMARLDDCLTATVEAKGSSRYAGQGRLITLLTVDDVREMISEWRKAGGSDD